MYLFIFATWPWSPWPIQQVDITMSQGTGNEKGEGFRQPFSLSWMFVYMDEKFTSNCQCAACNNCLACSRAHPAAKTNWFIITCSLRAVSIVVNTKLSLENTRITNAHTNRTDTNCCFDRFTCFHNSTTYYFRSPRHPCPKLALSPPLGTTKMNDVNQ